MFRFEQLEIWKLAVDYAKACYGLSEKFFPPHEKFSLGDQLRRAAISISNNIAEGSADSGANFKKYLIIALGSALETVNILNFAREMKYIDESSQNDLYQKAELLIKKLRSFSNSFK